MDDAVMDAYDLRCANIIAEYGWMVQFVGAGEDEPHFAYSVGYTETLDSPEILIFALPPEASTYYINDIGEQIKDGLVLEAGGFVPMRSGRPGVAYQFAVIPILNSRADLTMANRFFGNENEALPALQLVWPDANGRYPWHDDWSGGAAIPIRGPIPAEYL